MKKTIIITIIFTILFAAAIQAGTSYRYYRKLIKKQKVGRVREYWCEDLTGEILEKRGDDIIIEKIVGTVINNKLDGRIMNAANPKYNYISYRSVKGAKKGDTILTICIYNPGNSYCDDIEVRYDYIIDRRK